MQPSKNLGYLLHHLSFMVDQQSDQLLQERLGIGFAQFKILMALKWRDGVQQKQIAKYLGQTEASISRQIGNMHDKGLLESRVNPNSRRERSIVLTNKGVKLAENATSILNHYYVPMFARLSEKQQLQLAEILGIMHDEVRKGDQAGH